MLEIEVFNPGIEFFTRGIHMLKLFISILLIVDVFIDAREFTLYTGKVLAHMEDSEIVGYKGKPLVILLVLHPNGVIADCLESVLFNV